MQEPLRISGKEIAEHMLTAIAGTPTLTTNHLTGFVAANDPVSMSFQKAKQRAATKAGITYRISLIPDNSSQEEIAEDVRAAVDDPECGGIVIQLPLPKHLDAQALLDLVPPAKDPDLLSRTAYDAFITGATPLLPPAARAVQIIAAYADFSLPNKTIAIIGMGRLIGRPIAAWLASQPVQVIELDQGFDDSQLLTADLIITGTGAYTLDPELLKPGAGVIDFGYRKTDAGLIGDLTTTNPDSLRRLGFYTPTPGGTGPVLIAALIENFARLNA